MRELSDLVAYCSTYEFEDIISDSASVDIVKPSSYYEAVTSRKMYKLVWNALKSHQIAQLSAPCLTSFPVEQEYDLFFPVLNDTYDIFALRALKNWRQKSKKAVCYIGEIWDHFIGNGNIYLLDFLKEFDHIFLSASNYVELVAEVTGRPCSYLSIGVDALTFSPTSLSHHRTIDVCNIGRRSPVTHEALIELSGAGNFFYYYDTFKTSSGVKNSGKQQTFRVTSYKQHRFLIANILKRSRYFIANRGRINEPDQTQGKHELSSRFYEGAAAGAIMLGVAPNSDIFAQDFDWQDAVINMAFDEPDIQQVIAELDAQPDRLEKIRKAGVVNSLLRHDWVYRLRTVFETVGLPITPQMLSREKALKGLAMSMQ